MSLPKIKELRAYFIGGATGKKVAVAVITTIRGEIIGLMTILQLL